MRVAASEQGDGGFAVVDVDTLWRDRNTNELFHWKGRACKVCTRVDGRCYFSFRQACWSTNTLFTAVGFRREWRRSASARSWLAVKPPDRAFYFPYCLSHDFRLVAINHQGFAAPQGEIAHVLSLPGNRLAKSPLNGPAEWRTSGHSTSLR